MFAFFDPLNSDHVFDLTIVCRGMIFVATTAMGPVLAWNCWRIRLRETATEVVHAILNNGKHVDEIEPVLKAGAFSVRKRDTFALNFCCRSKTAAAAV